MILGSWSGMRKVLEQEMTAPCLRGRVRYGCTAYPGMDGCHIFEVCIDGKPVKRFSWETLNTFFLENGYKQRRPHAGTAAYWEDFWKLKEEVPPAGRTEYTDGEFCRALAQYRRQSASASLRSPDALVRMFAVLDRRVGRRALLRAKETIPDQPEWLRRFYRLRIEAEGL